MGQNQSVRITAPEIRKKKVEYVEQIIVVDDKNVDLEGIIWKQFEIFESNNFPLPIWKFPSKNQISNIYDAIQKDFPFVNAKFDKYDSEVQTMETSSDTFIAKRKLVIAPNFDE